MSCICGTGKYSVVSSQFISHCNANTVINTKCMQVRQTTYFSPCKIIRLTIQKFIFLFSYFCNTGLIRIKNDVNFNKWDEIHLSGVECQGDMAGNIIQQLLTSQTSYGQTQINFRLTNTYIHIVNVKCEHLLCLKSVVVCDTEGSHIMNMRIAIFWDV